MDGGLAAGPLQKGRNPEFFGLRPEEDLGIQDLRNFDFLLLLVRLLEERPLRKAIYVFSPQGRRSKGTIGELLRQLLGDYAAT